MLMKGQRTDVLGIRNRQNEIILGIGVIEGDFVILSKVFDSEGYKGAIAFDGTFLNDADVFLEVVTDFNYVMIPCSEIRAIYSYKDIGVEQGVI